MHPTYRPRGWTPKELDDARQRAHDAKLDLSQKVYRDWERSNTMVGQMVISNGGDVGYVDQKLGKQKPGKNRQQLDELQRSALLLSSSSSAACRRSTSSMESLVEICMRLAAQNSKDGFSALSQQHRLLLPRLLRSIAAQQSARASPISFEAYFAAARVFESEDVPKRWRTYKGLALDDAPELARIRKMNQGWLDEWRSSLKQQRRQMSENMRHNPTIPTAVADAPRCFVAIVDFLDLVNFGDAEIWKLRAAIASFVVVLRLSGTKVTDDGIAKIAARLGDEDAYSRLEVLMLRGCRITDRSAVKLAKFTTLRMIDLRGTSATTAFRQILNRDRPLPNWNSIRIRSIPESIGRDRYIELHLFGPSYSLAALLSQLRSLSSGSSSSPTVTKPLSVCINSLDHSQDDGPLTVAPKYDDSSPSASPDRLKATTAIYGTVFASKPIPEGVMELHAMEGEKDRSFRSRNDGIAGGTFLPTRISKPSKKKEANEELEEAGSDWGSEGEEEKDVLHRKELTESKSQKIRGARSDVVSGPLRERKAIPADSTGSYQMLLRHLPAFAPSPTPPLPPASPSLASADDGTTRAKPTVRAHALAALYSLAPAALPRLQLIARQTPDTVVQSSPSLPSSSVPPSPLFLSGSGRSSSQSSVGTTTTAGLFRNLGFLPAPARRQAPMPNVARAFTDEDVREPKRRGSLAAFRRKP